jgi:indolepyruvate ferredoxin oxidoreductase
MVSNKSVQFPNVAGLVRGIDRVTRKNDNVYLDAQTLAEGLFADSMATNMFMVGVAYQAGALPISAASIETAVKQAGVGVEMSLLAFKWGRMAVVDLDFVKAEIHKFDAKPVKSHVLSAEARQIVDSVGATGEVKRLVEVRVSDLIEYQDADYARRYAAKIKGVVEAEKRVAPESTALSEAAARYFYKLMAYKDEYEVARLHADPEFLAELDAQFPNGYTVEYNLAPPMFSKRDPETGELIKQKYGAWVLKAFRKLATFKNLRGGSWDFFGKTEERRHERQAIEDYSKLLDEITGRLSRDNHAVAVQLASVPDDIRGYGHVKEKNVELAKAKEAKLLEAFRNPQPARAAA